MNIKRALAHASDFGYTATELPDHFKANNEVGSTVIQVTYLGEYDDFEHVIARVNTYTDAVNTIAAHAMTHEPNFMPRKTARAL